MVFQGELYQNKARTEAVNKAIEDYIHREKVKKVMALEGSIDDFMSPEELTAMRELEIQEQEEMGH